MQIKLLKIILYDSFIIQAGYHPKPKKNMLKIFKSYGMRLYQNFL